MTPVPRLQVGGSFSLVLLHQGPPSTAPASASPSSRPGDVVCLQSIQQISHQTQVSFCVWSSNMMRLGVMVCVCVYGCVCVCVRLTPRSPLPLTVVDW